MPFLFLPIARLIAVAVGEALFKQGVVHGLDHLGVDDDTVATVADALGVAREKKQNPPTE